MLTSRLSCPHCAAALRVKDRMFVGRQVGCPDCGGPIRIVAKGPREFDVEKVEQPTTENGNRGAGEQQAGEPSPIRGRVSTQIIRPLKRLGSRLSALRSRLIQWGKAVATPAGAAWTAAATGTIVLLLLLRPSAPPAIKGTGQPINSTPRSNSTPGVGGTEVGAASGSETPDGTSDQPNEPGALATGPDNGGSTHDGIGKSEGSDPEAGTPGDAQQPAVRSQQRPGGRRPDPSPGGPARRGRSHGFFGQHHEDAATRPAADGPSPAPVDAPAPDPEKLKLAQANSTEPVDVASALKQPIRRFEQLRPAAFRDVLLLVEEMAGVPIRYDPKDGRQAKRDAEDVFERKVSFKLENTTVGEILDTLLAQVGFSYKIEADGIRLLPPKASDSNQNAPASSAGRISDNGTD